MQEVQQGLPPLQPAQRQAGGRQAAAAAASWQDAGLLISQNHQWLVTCRRQGGGASTHFGGGMHLVPPPRPANSPGPLPFKLLRRTSLGSSILIGEMLMPPTSIDGSWSLTDPGPVSGGGACCALRGEGEAAAGQG